MKRMILVFTVLTGLLICSTAIAKPFVIRAAFRLAEYSRLKGYTKQQIKNAPPEVVFANLNIDPNSPEAKKYKFFEPIIKAHVVQMIFPPTLTDPQKLMFAVITQFPDVITTPNADPNGLIVRIRL